MIYTVTLNPSLDYIVQVGSFQTGQVNRTSGDHKFPGGKGLNVSRVLYGLGHQSKAIGFVGGFTGEFIKNYLKNEGVESDFVSVDGDTRINLKIRSIEETEVNGQSPEITSQQIEELTNKLSDVKEDDIVVLAGSVPGSLSNTIYKQLMNALPKQTKVVVDTKGTPLIEAVEAKPFLIKPNHHELGDLFGEKVETPVQAAQLGRKLIEAGAQHVIVSMAGDGALFLDKEKTYFCNVPKGEVVNSVGAGDSVVAGCIARYVKTGELLDSFVYGVAAGSASAFSIGFCTEEKINELRTQIEIREMK